MPSSVPSQDRLDTIDYSTNEDNGFKFFCKKLLKLSQAKLKEKIFVGPKI